MQGGVEDRPRQRQAGRVPGDQAEQVPDGGRVARRQVVDPAHERGVAHLDGDGQHLVERIEHRDLQKDRQAPGQRIDLLPLIERHDLLLLLGRVILEALLHLFHQRLDLLHLGHRLVLLVGDREERHAHADGQQQDGDAEAADVSEDEVEEGEQRPGQEPEHPPVHRVVQVGDAQLGLVGGEQGNGLGAGEQVLGDADLGARRDHPRGAGIVGLIDVDAGVLGVAVDRVDRLGWVWDQRRQPVFVGDAGPGGGGIERLGRGALLRQVLVFEAPHAAVEIAGGALMDDAGLADIVRHALALDGAIGRKGHRSGAGVGHRVGQREQVVVVHLDPAGEGQPLVVGVGQRHRTAGRERRALGQGPQRRRRRQAGDVLAHPAIVHEPGEGGAFRPQQLDRRGGLVGGLAVLGEEQVVEPGAAQRDRAVQRRRHHRHAGAGGQGRGAGHRRRNAHAGHGQGSGRTDGGHGRGTAGGLGGDLGLAALGGRLQHELVVEQEHERRAHEEDDRVAVGLVLHGRGAVRLEKRPLRRRAVAVGGEP